jgi:hypothetical protein
MPEHPIAGAVTAAPGDAMRAHTLKQALARVLSSNHPSLELTSARTSVTFSIPLVPDASVTLLLDR